MKPEPCPDSNLSFQPGRSSRRQWLAGMTAAVGAGWCFGASSAAPVSQPGKFRFCLNTGTIRGQNLPLEKECEITAKAGYQGIEPWIEKIQRYVQGGGSLKDLARRLSDLGLTVEGAIGFPSWAVDDEAQRAKGFEQAKREMDMLAQLGARRIAAPPAGIPQNQKIDPERVAERYRQLLLLGDQMGVLPVLEFWGRNPTLGKLSTAVSIAVDSGHPKACVLADIFHMFRGGSPFEGLALLAPSAVPVLHMNDYPASPAPEQMNDGHRVMPGDGIAPIARILNRFKAAGASPVLSLELFNRDYWQKDPLEVARIGLEKMKTVAEA